MGTPGTGDRTAIVLGNTILWLAIASRIRKSGAVCAGLQAVGMLSAVRYRIRDVAEGK